MHIRESQNVIVHRAVNAAATQLPLIQATAQAAVKTAPVATQPGEVLRAGVQNIGDATLGK